MVAILAHRGASTAGIENTTAAFAAAGRLGADGVELDVRRSADGALVVHHDVEIPGRGPIASLRVAVLPDHVPLLDAAIAACGELVVNIELKDLPGEPGWDPGYPLAALVAAFVAERSLAGRVVVSSFELAALDAVRRLEPSIPTGWLTPQGFDQPAAVELVVARGHSSLHPQHRAVSPTLVDAAHRAGVTVTTWTVDDPHDMAEMIGAGVDGFITNRPDVARSVVDRLASGQKAEPPPRRLYP